jgi:hypothetical protein
MTFLSTQNFDENGTIKTIIKKRKILETGEVIDGKIKGTAKIKIEYGELTRDDLIKTGNLRATEGYILEEGNVFWGMSTPPINHIAEDSRLAHRISTAAASVGAHSTRGVANTIVCHPTARPQVDACWDKLKTVKQYDEASEEMIDVEKPYFPNGEMTVYEDVLAPEDKVLVLYKGEDQADQPFVYVDGEGLLLNNKLTDVENYGKFVRIT